MGSDGARRTVRALALQQRRPLRLAPSFFVPRGRLAQSRPLAGHDGEFASRTGFTTIRPRQAVGSGVFLAAMLARLAERRPKGAAGASSPMPMVVTQAALEAYRIAPRRRSL
jgi:hypothetical protein